MNKVRIGDLIQRHKELIKVEDNVTYKQVTIRVKHKGVVMRGTQQGSAIGTKNQYVARQGQFILSRIDARQGAFGVVPPELEGAIITNDFWCFDINEQLVLRDFFYTLIQAPDFDEACKKASIGTTNRQRINEDFFLNYELEIPPLADQQLAVRQIAAARQHLGRIDAEIAHQTILLARMRQAVLREAVQGCLVPQDATDESASSLLARIGGKKQRLMKEKKLQADMLLPLLSITAEIPYEVPKGWTWCHIEDACSSITDCVNKTAPLAQGITPYKMLRTTNIRHGKVDTLNVRYVSEETYLKWTVRDKPNKGDLILTREAPLGEVALVEQNDTIFLGQRLVQYRADNQILDKDFLFYVFSGPFMQEQIRRLGVGMTVKHLRVPDSKVLLFPLPPLAEQRRIVTKIAELLAYCTELEAELRQTRQAAEALYSAALRDAFKGVVDSKSYALHAS